MAWLILIVAGLLEIAWAVALKQSHGLTRLWPTVTGVAVALVSLVLLTIALRHVPASIGYAVWVGIGVVGVAIAGIVVFGEAVTPVRALFLSTIVLGIVGLRLAEG